MRSKEPLESAERHLAAELGRMAQQSGRSVKDVTRGSARTALGRIPTDEECCRPMLFSRFRLCQETIADGQFATWDLLYNLNVRTALVTTIAAAPLLAAGGSIVNVSAAATLKGTTGMGAYTASKSGVSRLTESMSGPPLIIVFTAALQQRLEAGRIS